MTNPALEVNTARYGAIDKPLREPLHEAMTKRKPRPVIPVALLDDAAMARRSSLFLWMRDNYETFSDVLARAGRPDWEALSKTFAEQGLRMQGDIPPSPVGSRQTWWKVRRVMARGNPPLSSPTPKAHQPAKPVRATHPPVARVIERDPDTDDEFDFSKNLQD